MELLSLEMTRLLDVIAHEIPGREDAAAVGEVNLRSLAGQVTQLARIAHEAAVMLRPGPEVQVMASPVLLWRVLTNLVDNAVRAAGSVGRVGTHRGYAGRTATTGPAPGAGRRSRASVMGLLEPPRSAWAW